MQNLLYAVLVVLALQIGFIATILLAPLEGLSFETRESVGFQQPTLSLELIIK